MTEARRAVVLLSGGLDSATVVAMAKDQGYAPHLLSFRYGQRNEVELKAARTVAAQARIEQHIIVDVDLRQFGGSALTSDIKVPKSRSSEEISDALPITTRYERVTH